jgi:hypothetical protein
MDGGPFTCILTNGVFRGERSIGLPPLNFYRPYAICICPINETLFWPDIQVLFNISSQNQSMKQQTRMPLGSFAPQTPINNRIFVHVSLAFAGLWLHVFAGRTPPTLLSSAPNPTVHSPPSLSPPSIRSPLLPYQPPRGSLEAGSGGFFPGTCFTTIVRRWAFVHFEELYNNSRIPA